MARRFSRIAAEYLKGSASFSTAAPLALRSRVADLGLPELDSRWRIRAPLAGQAADKTALWAALGGLLCLGVAHRDSIALTEPAERTVPPLLASEEEQRLYKRPTHRSRMPKEITLYQYEVCPFCNKVRAFLDYHDVPYRTVEVNPLTKAQLKWSSHNKVPVVMMDDQVVNDSSLILSQLAVELEPQATSPSTWSWLSRSKTASSTSISEAAEEEETRWRQWVDKKFVQLLTVNIYRTAAESWETFDYIANTSNFSFIEKQTARIAGSGLMYFVSGRMIKKYSIEGDLREALYAAANLWVEGLGSRQFMGGEAPNLADLSMFGVIRSITGTQTFTDLTLNSRIGAWYEHMMKSVGSSARLSS